jgi:uncharacterized protein (TIGR03437 family)
VRESFVRMIHPFGFAALLAGVFTCATAPLQLSAATVGSLVPVRGQLSDLAYDQRRGLVYATNFTAGRVEVISAAGQTLGTPFQVTSGPSSLALSPDGRYLVVGHYSGTPTLVGSLTIVDLDANQQRTVATNPVVAVAFGGGSLALVCTTAGFRVLDPSSGTLTHLALSVTPGTGTLPVNPGTFPPNILRASTGVSGDGQMVYILTEAGAAGSEPGSSSSVNYLFAYNVPNQVVAAMGISTSPPLGPRVVSVDSSGLNILAGWGLLRMAPSFHLLAQIPNSSGSFNLGSHAYDFKRNLIYAQASTRAATATGYPIEAPVLHVMDTDNLNVRERLKMTQWLAGRSIFSSDMQRMFSISDSGLLVFRVDEMLAAPRVVPIQEDLLFEGNSCDNRLITKTLQIVDPSGAHTDFRLSIPTTARGIRISPASGVTPATVTVEVDPVTYRGVQGTVAIPLTLDSDAAVNINQPIRILISTKDFDQKGRIATLPGRIVDLLADPARNRFYALRQDKNLVLAYDASTMQQIAQMRTGNTPVQMAITPDARWMLVGNENSQIANVYSLDALSQSDPVIFPFGQYPHSIAAAGGVILATTRSASGPHMIHSISFDQRIANAIGDPDTPGPLPDIFANQISDNSTLVASPDQGTILLAQPDGSLLLFETASGKWVAARKDLTGLSGAFASLGDNSYIIGNTVFDQALVPLGSLGMDTSSISTGTALSSRGLLRTSPVSGGVAIIERIDLAGGRRSARLAENPPSVTSTQAGPIGLIGQYALPFLRSLTVVPASNTYVSLSTSGMMVIPANFDDPAPIPSVQSVRNSADGTAGIAPGGLIMITGSGLTGTSDSVGAPPWPTALGNACVTLNNVAIPLSRVGPGEISAQLPFGASGGALVVRNAAGTSAPFTLTILASAPAIFRDGSAGPETGLATILRAYNNELLTISNPIHANDELAIYLTGAGNVAPSVLSGTAAPSDPLALVLSIPTVTLGDYPLPVLFAGLVPGQVGVYRIDVKIPDRLKGGWDVPLTIAAGTYATTLPVRVVGN